MSLKWDLQQLKVELGQLQKSGKVHFWTIHKNELNRRECYFSKPTGAKNDLCLDQSRQIEDESLYLTIATKKDERLIGIGQLKISQDADMHQEINRVVEASHVSQEEYYELPNEIVNFKTDKTQSYEPIKENIDLEVGKMTENLRAEVSQVKNEDFNSAELFVSHTKDYVFVSNGFEGEKEKTRIYAEVCFSAKSAEGDNEFMLTGMAMSPHDLSLGKMCKESSQFARATLQADKTPAGLFPVIIDQEVLAQLTNDAVSHLSAENKYLKLPFRSPGEEFIPGYKGESYSIDLDATRSGGFSSSLFTSEGLAEEKVELVKNNQVHSTMVSNKFAQYLKTTRTSDHGNVILTAKGIPFEMLTKEYPIVIQILQFSGLFSSDRDLTFSSEIRLAKVYDNERNKSYYVRGGNLSGQFGENFKNVKFSTENGLVNLNTLSLGEGRGRGFWGPRFALLNDVSISG